MIAEDELLKKGAPAARNLVALFEAQAKTLAERTAVTIKRDGRWQGVAWSEVARARATSPTASRRSGSGPAIASPSSARPTSSGSSPISASSGAAGITVTIYQSNKASECQYILADSGARFIFCDTDAQVAKIREVRGKLPALEGIIRASGSAADPFERTSRSSSAPARSGGAPTPTRTRAGSRRSGRRTGELHLHLGDHGQPEGRDPHPRQLGLRGVRGRAAPHHRPGRRRPHVPADGALLREGDRGGLVRDRRHGRVRRVAGEDPRQRLRGEAHGDAVGAAHLREGLQHRGLEGPRDPGPEGQAVPARDRRASSSTRPPAEQGKSYSSFGFTIGKKLVFPKLTHALNERFGGRMRLFVSGGAPLSPKIAYFFDVLGFEILEGYGLTETSAGTFVNRPGKNRIGTVGPPVPGRR